MLVVTRNVLITINCLRILRFSFYRNAFAREQFEYCNKINQNFLFNMNTDALNGLCVETFG